MFYDGSFMAAHEAAGVCGELKGRLPKYDQQDMEQLMPVRAGPAALAGCAVASSRSVTRRILSETSNES